MPLTTRQIENRKMLDKIKTDKGCCECGYNANPAALQFDHIDPDTKHITSTGKRRNPGSMISYSQSVILSEIAKCRILCANCHAIHTVEQFKEYRRIGRSVGKMSVPPVRLVA